MDNGFSPQNALATVLESISSSLAGFLPKFMTAVVVLLIGWLLAKIIAKAIRTAFDKFKLDDLLKRAGLTDILGKLGLQDPPGLLLSRLVYYLLLLLFIQSAAAAVGMGAVTGAIEAFFGYLPNLVAACLVLLLGLLIAQFAGGAVTRSARNSGVEFAPALGRIVSALIIFTVSLMAVTQLQLDTAIIRMVVTVLLAGMALALALTFGLGSRDITRNLIAGFYARKLFTVGETIEIDGQAGTLAGVSAVHVLIEADGRLVAIPNSVFLDGAVRQ